MSLSRYAHWQQVSKHSNIYVQYLTCMGNGFTKVSSHELTRQMDGPEFEWFALPA